MKTKNTTLLLVLLVFGMVVLHLQNLPAQTELNLVYHWSDSTLESSSIHSNTYNETWGFVQDGREYGVIGTTDGTHIFDVNDRNNIYEAAFIPGAVQGDIVVHRDYHDYNGYLYIVCDEGQSTLQIADLSYLPDSVHVVYDSDSVLQRSHNIFIDTAYSKLYACGGEAPFRVYSLANLESPSLIVNCNNLSGWSSIGYVHDVYVEDNIAYCNAGNNGLFVVDFTNTSSPVVLGSLTSYPEKGYNHSGWLHQSKPIYAMADETWGTSIKICDVSDLTDIKISSLINSNVDSQSIPHNLIFKDDYLYISYYHDGVYIYDVSDAENPVQQYYFDTSHEPHANNYRGCWGIYPFLPSNLVLASDMQEGFFMFDGGPVSVKEKSESLQSFRVFPNPIDDFLLVKSPGKFLGTEATISDINGRIVERFVLSRTTTPVQFDNDMKAGIYFLRVENGNGSFTQKLVKH